MTSVGLYAFILATGYVQAMSNRRKVRVGPVNFYVLPFFARDHSSRAQAIRAMNSKFDGLLLRPFLPAGKSRSHCSAGPLDRAEEIAERTVCSICASVPEGSVPRITASYTS